MRNDRIEFLEMVALALMGLGSIMALLGLVTATLVGLGLGVALYLTTSVLRSRKQRHDRDWIPGYVEKMQS